MAKVRHVKRNANKASHGMAREAVKNYGDNIWMEEIPHVFWIRLL
jgi:hypothetical protein